MRIVSKNRSFSKKNFSDREEIWDFIVDNGIATDDEVRLVIDINGYSEGSLNDIIYARTGFRSMEQCKESEGMEDFACGGKGKKKFAEEKSIREKVIDAIYDSDEVYDLIKDFEVRTHCDSNGEITDMFLAVTPDGTFDTVELSKGVDYSDDYLVLASLYDVGCNCEWCGDYEAAERAVEYDEADEEEKELIEEFPDKSDYIEMIISENDIIGPLQHQYADVVKKADYGFFDDEEKDFACGSKGKKKFADLSRDEKLKLWKEQGKLYMNPATGSVDVYDGWWYEDEDGKQINAVETGEVAEVYKDEDGNWQSVWDVEFIQ